MQQDLNPYDANASVTTRPLNEPPTVFPPRALWGSLLVMLPWPLLGLAACLGFSLFEKASETIFLFGSITMIFLLPIGMIVNSEGIFGALVGLVWLVALFAPLWFVKKPIHPRLHVPIVLACQSLFSAAQAGLGFLMILGKYC